MARSDDFESPRSSRRSRRNSLVIPPPVPEVDWSRARDVVPESPPRRNRVDRDRDRSRNREREVWNEEIVILRTPESRASSSSYHPSRHQHQRAEYSRDRSTPAHSIASSKTSVRTPQPQRSSMTRHSVYRRPSIPLREMPSVELEDDALHESRRSVSRPRSIHMVPSVPLSRRTSRTFVSNSLIETESEGEDTETTYDSCNTRRERSMVPLGRQDTSRSRSRPDISRTDYGRRRRRLEPVRPDPEDDDETYSRHTPIPAEEPPVRTPSRTRSLSRPASVRHVQAHDHGHDADSEMPSASDLRDRFERQTSRKHRHGSHINHKRTRSESHTKRSSAPKRYVLSAVFGLDSGSSRRVRSTSKRYYDTEVLSVEKVERHHHPPSASLRRSNTVSAPAAASQHQSVSSSTRKLSSSNFFGNLFGPSLHGNHHHAPGKPVKLVECVICMDELPARKVAKLKCGHRMCNTCLKRSFKLSITDPQHMPPKCCTQDNIPLKHVERIFDNDFKKNWNKKFVEYSSKNRIYCPRRGCNEFIRREDTRQAEDGRKHGKCPKCKTKVCVQCNGKLHPGTDCPRDEETLRILEKAKQEGWKRCFRCKAMVELKEGCNHMTCLCGAEFCMVCGARWKTCDCPWFNYETVENDRLQHMQVPMDMRNPFERQLETDVPPSPTREGRSGGLPRPQTYEQELRLRRAQEGRDEAFARRLQHYQEFDDVRDDDFIGGLGDITAIGNAAGHFMNDSFRPRQRHIVLPPPPPPPPPMPPMSLEPAPGYERAQTGDYIQGVNRARGVPGGSLERRLADRFNSDHRQNPRSPPTLQSAATMPILTPNIGTGPVQMPLRRHSIEPDEMYSTDARPRTMERVNASARTTRPIYFEEPEDIVPLRGMAPRKQHVRDEPKQSAMAGLTGGKKSHARVEEWAHYVRAGMDSDSVAS